MDVLYSLQIAVHVVTIDTLAQSVIESLYYQVNVSTHAKSDESITQTKQVKHGSRYILIIY